MKLTKFTKLLAVAVVATASAMFTGCSSDDEPIANFGDNENLLSRASVQGESTVITFDDFSESMMANPTSYGANYYGPVGSLQQVTEISDNIFISEVNEINGSIAFWNGGIALSNWNYMSNPTDTSNITKPSGVLAATWWYSYQNQMSVYNTASSDGSNVAAGHSGNNFAVVYGYQDSYNSKWMDKPSFELKNKSTLVGLWYCNSSYTYGVMMNGNKFGNIGVAGSMPDTKGYFEVILECYDEKDNLIATKTELLADYRTNNAQVVPTTTWTYWPINVAGVKTVKFNFTGSDTGAYGLNTPAYLCIDDIVIK